MKGEKQVIERLNEALFLELGAVNQYWVHYRLLEDWGYTKHHLPGGTSKPSVGGAAAHRPERQGSAGIGPCR